MNGFVQRGISLSLTLQITEDPTILNFNVSFIFCVLRDENYVNETYCAEYKIGIRITLKDI